MSVTFSSAAFARAHGSRTTDRRDARVDEAVERDMARLRQIADAARAALIAVRTIGPPAHSHVAGEDYEDYVARLEDLIPDVSAAAEAKLREHIVDKAMAGGWI